MAGQSQRTGEWRRHFPIGVLLALGAATTLPSAGDRGTSDQQCNNVTGLTEHILNAYAGLAENNLRYVLFYSGSPYNHEQQQALMAVLEANQQDGNLWAFFQLMTRRTSTVGTGLNEEFTTNGGVANTRAVADPLVQTVVNDMSDHPALLAYILDDDTDSTADATKAAKNNTLVQSFQALDPHGRPASAMWRNRGYSDLGSDCQFIITYEYPCGKYSNGTDTAEGDFHRSTFGSITGTSNPDWVDVIRHRTALLPTGARHIWCLQAHNTASGAANTQLRAPTDREIRTQIWLGVAEGVTGFFFFTGTNFDVPGGSSNQPMLLGRRSALAVAREMSDRLNPSIRSRLLGCTAAGSATAFTASGGGTGGLPVNYSNAHVGELTHADGTKYVVVCNRSTSTAAVTVSHPSLTGYLLSLENGTRYKLGTDAISVPALDGTILVYEPARLRAGRRGVPVWDVDLTQSVETWWAAHWANPTAAAYISAANLPLHTRVVSVPVGASLQAYVDAAPEYTTFSLASGGVYGEVQILERSHLHFTSADSNNKAQIARVKIWGSRYAQQYNSQGTDYGFVAQLYSNTSDSSLTTGGGQSIRNQARRRFLRYPSEDIVFDQIDFRPDSQAIVYYKLWDLGPGAVMTDHWYEGAPISMRCVKDVVIQRCTVSGYKWGSDNAAQTSPLGANDPQENNTGPVSHPGLFWGNAGIRNMVIRDNTFTFATNAANTGSPSAAFFDGCQGGVFYNNTGSGKLNQDMFNFLINDDYTEDFRLPGTIDPIDRRESRYVVIASNTMTPTNQPALVSFSGSQLLVKGNTLNFGTSTPPAIINLASKACRYASTRGVYYECYDAIIDGNTVTANGVTAFVSFNGTSTYSPGLTYTSLVRSKLGRATVKNNSATKQGGGPSTITRWAVEDSASLAASPQALIDVATTYSGNNVNDSFGVGV